MDILEHCDDEDDLELMSSLLTELKKDPQFQLPVHPINQLMRDFFKSFDDFIIIILDGLFNITTYYPSSMMEIPPISLQFMDRLIHDWNEYDAFIFPRLQEFGCQMRIELTVKEYILLRKNQKSQDIVKMHFDAPKLKQEIRITKLSLWKTYLRLHYPEICHMHWLTYSETEIDEHPLIQEEQLKLLEWSRMNQDQV